MKQFQWLIALFIPLILAACGSDDDFQGRFIAPNDLTSYEFFADGTLIIIEGVDDQITTKYQYDKRNQTITLSNDLESPHHTFIINNEGNLEAQATTLIRGISDDMLADSTWIGHQGDYSFALTFSETDEGMETASELVTYYPDEMSYLSQQDDSITRLNGNMMFVDLTQYTVSDVTQDSFKLTIGGNSMVLKKHPKATEIIIREGYTSEDEAS